MRIRFVAKCPSRSGYSRQGCRSAAGKVSVSFGKQDVRTQTVVPTSIQRSAGDHKGRPYVALALGPPSIRPGDFQHAVGVVFAGEFVYGSYGEGVDAGVDFGEAGHP